MNRIILFAVIFCCMSSCHCIWFKKEKKPVNTTVSLTGKRYEYVHKLPDYVEVEYVEFQNDSIAILLLGGDVLNAATYQWKNDTISCNLAYTKQYINYVYKNDTLISNNGKRLIRK